MGIRRRGYRPRAGPFISGADTILDVLAEHIPNAADGFKIVFSARPFPGYTNQFAVLG